LLEVGITGSNGVLGRKIVKFLHQNSFNVKKFTGDITKPHQVQDWFNQTRCSVYIHSAAMVPVSKVTNDISLAIEVNVIGTANVARAAESVGARLIYISSSHVYSSSVNKISETDECDPSSFYGITKYQGETWALKLCSKTLIARVFSFFDPSQQDSFLVPSLKSKIISSKKDSTIILPGLMSQRDIIGSDFPAKVISYFADKEYTGIVNVGTGEGIEIGELATMLAKELKREDITFIPEVGDKYDSLICDNKKLKNIMGKIPRISLQKDLGNFAK
jgi:nucleoside-diphosphate-sugar epimerase